MEQSARKSHFIFYSKKL